MIQVQKRMLVEQRAVIERLSCKLGKDHEDLELQFSAAVAKVMAAMMVLLSELKKTSAEKSQSQCIPKGLQ